MRRAGATSGSYSAITFLSRFTAFSQSSAKYRTDNKDPSIYCAIRDVPGIFLTCDHWCYIGQDGNCINELLVKHIIFVRNKSVQWRMFTDANDCFNLLAKAKCATVRILKDTCSINNQGNCTNHASLCNKDDQNSCFLDFLRITFEQNKCSLFLDRPLPALTLCSDIHLCCTLRSAVSRFSSMISRASVEGN